MQKWEKEVAEFWFPKILNHFPYFISFLPLWSIFHVPKNGTVQFIFKTLNQILYIII